MLATIDQMITGLASFGALDYIRSHKSEMQPLLTLDGAKYFQPTPDLFLEGLNVMFSEEGSSNKACEIDGTKTSVTMFRILQQQKVQAIVHKL